MLKTADTMYGTQIVASIYSTSETGLLVQVGTAGVSVPWEKAYEVLKPQGRKQKDGLRSLPNGTQVVMEKTEITGGYTYCLVALYSQRANE